MQTWMPIAQHAAKRAAAVERNRIFVDSIFVLVEVLVVVEGHRRCASTRRW
jgi:hypothetical protein